jgi:ketosteroid isomerase-like protein
MQKTTLTIISLFFAVTTFCQKVNLVTDILQKENILQKAIVASDTFTVSTILADDYTFTVPEGINISKKQFLQDMTTFWKPTSIIRSEQKVRISGSTAIVVGLSEYRWNANNQLMTAYERYTDIWTLHKKKWRLSAAHGSEVAIIDKKTLENEAQTTLATLWKAWETGNKLLAEPIYASDFIDTDFEGTTRNRNEVLAFLNPLPKNQNATITLSNWHFIVRGSIVVANYIVEDRRVTGDKISIVRFRATDTVVKKYGHWQIIAGQQILIKDK